MVISEKESIEASDSNLYEEYFTILTVLGTVKAHSSCELKVSNDSAILMLFIKQGVSLKPQLWR